MRRLLSHLRGNAVAYLALFVAMGGTGYAATNLPARSVGNRQLRNHSINPDKLNPRYIHGSVRIWASVSASGKVIAGGRGVTVIPQGEVPGDYLISPSSGSATAIPRRCAAIASVDDAAPKPGYAEAQVAVFSRRQSPRWQIVVNTYEFPDTEASLPFAFAVVC
jgi:hypothetical protein